MEKKTKITIGAISILSLGAITAGIFMSDLLPANISMLKSNRVSESSSNITINTGLTVKTGTAILNTGGIAIPTPKFIFVPVANSNNFNGATVAYKFSILQNNNFSGSILLNSVKIRCTYAGPSVNVQLERGDVNTRSPMTDLSLPTAMPSNVDTNIIVNNSGMAQFGGTMTFSIILRNAMTAGSKSCQIVNSSVTQKATSGATQTFGSVASFPSTMIQSLPVLTLQ